MQTKNLLQSALALHDSARRLRAVASNLPALIGYWNADLRRELANEADRDMARMGPPRIVCMRLEDLSGPAPFQSIETHKGQPLRAGP